MFDIPPDLIVTAPDDTEKSPLSKDATPLLDAVASSAAIVNVSPETEVSIPSPPDTVNVSPKSTALVVPLSAPTEIVEFASLPFAIEPASCVFDTPPDLILTAPDETSKSAEAKDATPLLDAVASSAAIVISSSETVVSIPSPPENVNVPPVLNVSLEPLSAASESVCVTVPKDNAPEPFVFKNWSEEPSAAGNVNVTFAARAFGDLS